LKGIFLSVVLMLVCVGVLVFTQISGQKDTAIGNSSPTQPTTTVTQENNTLIKSNTRTYALYKLTIMCMNDIWSFQALRMKSR
jgi:peptidylprolyl isomerase